MDEGLLQRTPTDAVSQIALALLDEARAARVAWVAGTDPEALHDFRVAIRRLRSTAAAWRKALRGRIGKARRNALRDLQRATGGARDAEVALAWLDEQPPAAAPDAEGRAALRRHLCSQMDAGTDGREQVVAAFDQLEAKLRVSLSAGGEDRGTYAEALAKSIRKLHARLRKRLERACVERSAKDAHSARIRGKRLRYLVEPIVPYVPRARAVVKGCKRIQDLLGDLNDAEVLGEELRGLRIDPERAPDEQPGLATLAAQVAARHERLFDRTAAWWSERGPGLAADVESVARALELTVADAEIERSYLLTGLPEIPAGARVREMEQGYLPAVDVGTEERVRRIREGEDVQHVRTVKQGTGVERREIEEVIDAERFDTLWARTEGRRLRKRRHVVTVDGLVWEIDEFLDRDLVLAEVELSSVDQDVVLPPWITACMDREVTDDLSYANSNLAC